MEQPLVAFEAVLRGQVVNDPVFPVTTKLHVFVVGYLVVFRPYGFGDFFLESCCGAGVGYSGGTDTMLARTEPFGCAV